MITFKSVQSARTAEVALLADEIWHECYKNILTDGQIDYMLASFQSPEAFDKMIGEGYSVFTAEDGQQCGYFAYKTEEGKVFLSKLYIKNSFRGRGISRLILNFIADNCADSARTLYLTVNVNNANAIAVYTALGMKNIGSQKTDIGNGYIMDDYIFEIRFDELLLHKGVE